MLGKNELKYFASLKQKKYRLREGKFLAEGKRLVAELIESPYPIEAIIATEEFKNKNHAFFAKAKSKGLRTEIVKPEQLKKLTDTQTPQGVAAVARFLAPDKNQNRMGKLIVALDKISEPGNVGTILRNCGWFGVQTVLVSKSSADVFNPKTLRASMGAAFRLNILSEINLKESLLKLKNKGYKILLADIEGTEIKNLRSAQGKFVVIFSNEAAGPSEEAISLADEKVTVPRKGQGESLNVASASAIVLYELTN